MSEITFSSDGIRGIVGDWPFTQNGMYCIGQALSGFLLRKKIENYQVVLGRDTRPSGKDYIRVLKSCFIDNGINVLDLGIAPTPVVAYITKTTRTQLGIVVSASHNPANYNGIKLVDSNGLRLQPDKEKEIKELLVSPNFTPNTVKKRRTRRYQRQKTDQVKRYIADHIKMLGRKSLLGLNLVIDCSNGAVSRTGEQLLTGLGASVTSLNNDMTGEKKINDNCGSEYYRRYPEKLIKIVRQKGADYGFAFDGDGDRIVVVDRKGNFYNGDDLIYILAVYYAKRNELQNNKVVITDSANSGLKQSLKELGIETIKTLNGDRNLEAKMWGKKNSYMLGAEQVGNIIINDEKHGAADSLYAISLLFKLLSTEEAAVPKETILKEKAGSLKKWPQVLATVHMTEKISQKDINWIKKEIKNKSGLKYHIRIKAWYSSTESGLFNVMIEGAESGKLEVISGLAIQFCRKVLRLTHEKPRVFDLSSRKRLGITKS